MKLFHSRLGQGCVYCDSSDHKANDCQKVTTVADRKQILAKKHLCFNCALGSHQAAKCQSKNSCQKCGKRHHTSICDKSTTAEERKIALTANEVGEGVFPVVLVKVDGITTRALIDSGSSSSYVSAKVADMMNKKPSERTTRQVEMLMGTHTTQLELYDAELSSIDGEFKMDAKLTKVNKSQSTIPTNGRDIFPPTTSRHCGQGYQRSTTYTYNPQRGGLCQDQDKYKATHWENRGTHRGTYSIRMVPHVSR